MSTRVRELERRGSALGVGALVFLAGVLTLAVTAVSAWSLSPWWPPVGIACTLLTVTPRRWWWWVVPTVVAANTGANVLFDRPVPFAVTLSVVVALEAVIFACVIRLRRGGLAVLGTQVDFLRLIAAAALSAGIGGAVAGVALPLVGGPDSGRAYLLAIAPSHAAAVLVLAPVLLSLRRPLVPVRMGELVLQTCALTFTTLLVFGVSDVLAMAFVPIPFLVWAAFKFGLRVVAVQIAVIATIVSGATSQGLGPFAVNTGADAIGPWEATSLVQTFLMCIVLICVPLAINVEQTMRLNDQLRATGDLFRRNFSESLVAMLVLRAGHDDFEVFDANQQTTTLLGLDREQVVGQPLSTLLETTTPLSGILDQMVAGTLDGWRGEGRMAQRPERQIALSVAPLSGSGGEPMFSAQLLDLTDERVARADLDAERRLSDITLATTACLILVCDLRGTVLRANPALASLVGACTEELVGRPVWEVAVPEEHRDLAQRMFAEHDPDPIPSAVESTLLDAEGHERRIAWTSGVVSDPEGQATYLVMTGLDVTAERNAAGLTQHLLAAALDTALIGIDPVGRITLFNSGAEKLLSAPAFATVGTPFVDLLVPDELATWAAERDSAPTFPTVLEHLLDQQAQDWTWRRSDGSRTLVSMSLTRVTDDNDLLIGYLCLGNDVTEARHNQEVLATALEKERTVVERLRHLDVAKDEFVSTVSHELRTPVASIVGYTELLQDGDFGEIAEEQAPVVDAINRNGQRLVNLVDNLLALNGLAADLPAWERARIDLVDLVHALEHTTVASEAARRLQLCFRVPEHPILVEGDWSQLERALSNLLSNAMKFTEPRGQVTCVLTYDATLGEAVVEVSDTGLGIPRDEQENLFKRFWRSSTAQARHIQGTGLGLTIVQTVVASHGGTVTLESEHLAGTVATIRLPASRE